MKKTLLISVLCLAFVMTASATDYTPLKNVMTKMADAFESLGKQAEAVKDAKGAAAALRGFTKDMDKIIPEMVEVAKKYPELKNMKDTTKAPAELKPLVERMNKIQPMMQAAMMKIMAHGNDPEVQKAMMEMQAVMMKMQQLDKGAKK